VADIKIEDLGDAEELNLEDAKQVYGGAGTTDPSSTDGNQAPTVPILPYDPNQPLPGQGDAGGGGGTSPGCQL
jgi:hypothetical protein